MRVIANANFKGGTAKTTTCCNLAAMLARDGRRVLVIDADAQHNTTDFFLADAEGCTLTDVLEGNGETVAADNIVRADRYDVDLLPADMGLLRLDLRAILEQANAPLRRMDDFIDALRADGEYEFVLFDCPPQFTAASVAALLNSDEVILPTKVDSFSRAGVLELVDQLGRVGLRLLRPMPRVRVLVTMADKTNLSRQGEALLRSSGFEVFRTVIRAGVAVGESSYARQPLYEYAPKSKPAQDYEALLGEILGENGGRIATPSCATARNDMQDGRRCE